MINGVNNDLTREILNLDPIDPLRSFNKTTRQKPFYMVFCEGGSPPNKVHWDFPTALTESSRLAKNSPGRKFFILQAVALTESQITPVRTERLVD